MSNFFITNLYIYFCVRDIEEDSLFIQEYVVDVFFVFVYIILDTN